MSKRELTEEEQKKLRDSKIRLFCCLRHLAKQHPEVMGLYSESLAGKFSMGDLGFLPKELVAATENLTKMLASTAIAEIVTEFDDDDPDVVAIDREMTDQVERERKKKDGLDERSGRAKFNSMFMDWGKKPT